MRGEAIGLEAVARDDVHLQESQPLEQILDIQQIVQRERTCRVVFDHHVKITVRSSIAANARAEQNHCRDASFPDLGSTGL